MYLSANSKTTLTETNLQSEGKDFRKQHQQESKINLNDKTSTHLTLSSCEKQITTSADSTPKSSKMISTDAYLPTHSASSVSSNAFLATLGNTNDSDLPPPPPSYSRLPPDGHEFPPDYKDPSCTSNSIVYRVSIHFLKSHDFYKLNSKIILNPYDLIYFLFRTHLRHP